MAILTSDWSVPRFKRHDNGSGSYRRAGRDMVGQLHGVPLPTQQRQRFLRDSVTSQVDRNTVCGRASRRWQCRIPRAGRPRHTTNGYFQGCCCCTTCAAIRTSHPASTPVARDADAAELAVLDCDTVVLAKHSRVTPQNPGTHGQDRQH